MLIWRYICTLGITDTLPPLPLHTHATCTTLPTLHHCPLHHHTTPHCLPAYRTCLPHHLPHTTPATCHHRRPYLPHLPFYLTHTLFAHGSVYRHLSTTTSPHYHLSPPLCPIDLVHTLPLLPSTPHTHTTLLPRLPPPFSYPGTFRRHTPAPQTWMLTFYTLLWNPLLRCLFSDYWCCSGVVVLLVRSVLIGHILLVPVI